MKHVDCRFATLVEAIEDAREWSLFVTHVRSGLGDGVRQVARAAVS